MYDCTGKEAEPKMVYLWICEDLPKAFDMRRQLEIFYALAPKNVAEPYCVGRLKHADLKSVHNDYTSTLLEIPPEVKMLKTEKPCLITGQVSTLTFDKWLPNSNEQDSTLLFRSLFSTVGKFHQAKMSFGNIRAGIRITGKSPIFVIPAATEEEDEGIRKDIGELHDMLMESKIQGFFEMELFDKLCKKCTQMENGSFTYSGESLRQLSFIITHCPVVWTSEDRYNFIEKLEKYRDFNRSLYDLLTSDLFARAILTVDFWTRLDTAAPSTSAFMLQPLYTQGKNTSYTNMEGIRSFHKYAYAHNPPECPLWSDVEKVLYSVFPEAPASLYEIIVGQLHFSSNASLITNTQSSMPSIIKFLQDGPYKFEF
ncbi:hypothetical protein ACET3Z_019590 [Daucus carota]